MPAAVKLADIVRPGSLLFDLDREFVDKLEEIGSRRPFSKDKTIFGEGDDADYIGVVLSGRVKIQKTTASGKHRVQNILQAGDVVGEIAVIDGGVRSAEAVATDAGELHCIPRAAFLTLVESNGRLGFALCRAISLKLRDSMDALSVEILPREKKLASAILRLIERHRFDETPDGALRYAIKQGPLAEFAGLSRANANRALKHRFAPAGAARHENGILIVTDADWLRDFVDEDDDAHDTVAAPLI